MLNTLRYVNGQIKKGVFEDAKKKGILWVDCHNPSHAELKKISDNMNIPIDVLEDSLDDNERPRVNSYDNFDLVVFKAPHFKNSTVDTTSFAIFLFKDNMVTLRNHEINSMERIYHMSDEAKIAIFKKGISNIVYRLIDEILITYNSVIEEVTKKIEKIEEQVFEDPEKAFIKELFALKKTLIYFYSALTANREVISHIEKEDVATISGRELKHFRALYYDVWQSIDQVTTSREIITSALDMYLTQQSNSLNQIMKRLTAWAGLILIPTLISGIYGMNFRAVSGWNMPELNWYYGYPFALGLMVISVILLAVYFKKKDWL